MRPKDRWVCVWMAAACATALAYPFVPTGPRYFPLEHAWHWATVAGAPSMGWYAKAGWALLLGGMAAGGTGMVLRIASARAAELIHRGLSALLIVSYPLVVVLLVLQEFVWKAH